MRDVLFGCVALQHRHDVRLPRVPHQRQFVVAFNRQALVLCNREPCLLEHCWLTHPVLRHRGEQVTVVLPPFDLLGVHLWAVGVVPMLVDGSESAAVHDPVVYRKVGLAVPNGVDRDESGVKVLSVRRMMQSGEELHRGGNHSSSCSSVLITSTTQPAARMRSCSRACPAVGLPRGALVSTKPGLVHMLRVPNFMSCKPGNRYITAGAYRRPSHATARISPP